MTDSGAMDWNGPSGSQAAPFTGLRGLVASHPIAAYIFIACAIPFPLALVPFFTDQLVLPYDTSLWAPITGLACAFAAFSVVSATHGWAGVRELANRSLRWRVGIEWYFAAVLALPVAVLLIASAIFVLDPLSALVDKWTLLFTLVLPQFLFRLAVLNLTEEVGFMGFLQATLQDRYGPLKASALATVPFAFWHLPDWMIEFEIPLTELYIGLAIVVVFGVAHLFARIVIMWLYNGAGRSVLLVALFHSTFNTVAADKGFGGEFIGEFSGAAFFIATGVVILTAIILVFFTRGRLAFKQIPSRA